VRGAPPGEAGPLQGSAEQRGVEMNHSRPSRSGDTVGVSHWALTAAGVVLLVSGALVAREVVRSGPAHHWWGWVLSAPVLLWWMGCATLGVWVERLRHPHRHRPLAQYWAFTILVAAGAAAVTTATIHLVALVARTAGPVAGVAALYGVVFLCAGGFVGLLWLDGLLARWRRRR
jgi:hypothetical protein